MNSRAADSRTAGFRILAGVALATGAVYFALSRSVALAVVGPVLAATLASLLLYFLAPALAALRSRLVVSSAFVVAWCATACLPYLAWRLVAAPSS